MRRGGYGRVRGRSLTAMQALMLEISWALPCEVSVPSRRSTICGCCGVGHAQGSAAADKGRKHKETRDRCRKEGINAVLLPARSSFPYSSLLLLRVDRSGSQIKILSAFLIDLELLPGTRGAASIIVMRRIPCVALAVILLACSCHARVVGGERRVQAQSQDMESDEVEVCGPPNTEFSSIAAQEFNFYSDPLRLDGQFLSLASLPSK